MEEEEKKPSSQRDENPPPLGYEKLNRLSASTAPTSSNLNRGKMKHVTNSSSRDKILLQQKT